MYSQIARRLRLHESPVASGSTTPQQINERARSRYVSNNMLKVNITERGSSVISCLLLVSVLGAVHLNIPCYLTPGELSIQFDGTSNGFDRVYASLLKTDNDFMPDLNAEGQPLLLLLAILSDSIAVRRSLASLARLGSSSSKTYVNARCAQSPYQVLSPSAEFRRMQDQLLNALDKWEKMFGAQAEGNENAFFHFCRLHIVCDDLLVLPQLAKYAPAVQREGPYNAGGSITVSDQAVAHAWTILENVDTKSTDEGTICPIWCPIVVFYGALAVWASIRQQGGQSTKYGSLKQLLAFKIELERMPWPCCEEMASTLDRLLQKPSAI